MSKKQLSFFELPEIDRTATKDALEQAFEKYRIFLLMTPEEQLPKVTQTFSLVPSSNTNAFHSSTENAAINNVDNERYRNNYMKKIQKAVNRLNLDERSVIIKKYMSDENVFDYEVWNDIGMSERKYYRVKSRALYKLAFIMKADMYLDNDMKIS